MGWHFGQGLNVASLPSDNVQAALQFCASSYSEMWHTLTVTMASRTLDLKHRIKYSQNGLCTPVAFIRSTTDESNDSLASTDIEEGLRMQDVETATLLSKEVEQVPKIYV